MGHNNVGSKLIRRAGIGIIGFSALTVGGFAAATEPAAPEPKPGEQAIAYWPPTRPFVPGSLNTLINQAVGKEHRDDLTMSATLYRSPDVGNYAVASYNLFGESKLTGKMVCMYDQENSPETAPGDVLSGGSIRPAPQGIKIFVDKEGTEHFGRVLKAQTIEVENSTAIRICTGGLEKQDYKLFGKPEQPR